jgi:predicted ribonuclease toxin of YeeF-YezG toxin-antitoxin module
MLKLLVPNAEVADSVLRVDWCVGPEELEIIQREKILNPHVLLVVGQKYVDYHTRDGEAIEKHFEKSRYLVPMEAGTKFIEFHSPGKYEIHASIVGEAGKVDFVQVFRVEKQIRNAEVFPEVAGDHGKQDGPAKQEDLIPLEIINQQLNGEGVEKGREQTGEPNHRDRII